MKMQVMGTPMPLMVNNSEVQILIQQGKLSSYLSRSWFYKLFARLGLSNADARKVFHERIAPMVDHERHDLAVRIVKKKINPLDLLA